MFNSFDPHNCPQVGREALQVLYYQRRVITRDDDYELHTSLDSKDYISLEIGA